ncbi:hypothetical protein ADH76_07670 [Enterocloster clostridioformis]|nr:hypothetical protein A4V08_32070 [Lachnoclostridium sp. YL32]NDO28747.1 hypothetical protein [Enterocloster clostridioformis]OXE71167.1 hypothetical protein ADH76_07670 [Enterocloster clostridioformis]
MGKTIGELMEEMRVKAGAQNYVLTRDSPVGFKGDRMRLFLSDTGYQRAQENQEKGHIRILNHAKVIHGDLFYDHKDCVR